MEVNTCFDINFIKIEDIQNIIQESVDEERIPRILTVNGKVLDEEIGLDLAELFPPDILGARNQLHVTSWKCNHCSKIEYSISAYAKHLRIHYKCKQIPKQSVLDTDKVECDICDKSFSQKFFLYRHLQKHTGEFTCYKCLTIFSRNRDLINHQKKCKDGDGIILECVICKLVLQTRKGLKEHLISNHSAAPSSSRYCDVTRNRSETDTKLGKYTCTYCEKSYLKKNLLSSHIKNKHNIYGLNADQECFICNIKFSSVTSALRHRRFHTHGKIYNCADCDMTFISESLLKQHAVKHQNITYSCPYCETVVRYRHSMKRHFKKYHPEELHSWNAHNIKKLETNVPLKKSKPKKEKLCSSTRPLAIKQNTLLHTNNNETIDFDLKEFDSNAFIEESNNMDNLCVFDSIVISNPVDNFEAEFDQFQTDCGNSGFMQFENDSEETDDYIYVNTDTGELIVFDKNQDTTNLY